MQKQIDQLMAQGKAYIRENKIKDGIQSFAKVIQLNPKHAEAYLLRGVSYARLKTFDKALSDIDTAIKLRNGDYPAASKERDKIVSYIEKLDPQKVKAATVNPNAAAEAEKMFELGVEAYGQQDFEMGLRYFAKVIELQPRHVMAYNYRGSIYHRMGYYEDALDAHDTAIKLDPSFARSYYYRALILWDISETESALNDVKKAISLDPKEVDYHINLTAVMLDMKQYQEAIQYCTKMLKAGMDAEQFYRHRGLAYLALKDFEKAKQDFHVVVKRDVHILQIYHALYDMYVMEKASKLSEKDNAKIDELRLTCGGYLKQGKYNDALKVAKNALKISPDHAVQTVLVARVYREMGNNKEALKFANKAIEQFEFIDLGYYFRAAIEFDEKNPDYEKIIENCNRCLNINPNLYAANYMRGRAIFVTTWGVIRETGEATMRQLTLLAIAQKDLRISLESNYAASVGLVQFIQEMYDSVSKILQAYQ